jgi:hypothetical protein
MSFEMQFMVRMVLDALYIDWRMNCIDIEIMDTVFFAQ